jgi:hypothetical protein
MSVPPLNPDIRRQLKIRLLDLSPRAFELFAGDLLVYLGLQDVAVTRYIGDGGIDAHGDIVTHSGIVRIPTGIQVKRQRQNVQRSDIDRFIGALSGHYSQGIFITTAGYAAQALTKASSSFPHVTPIHGDQVIGLMLQHQMGLITTTGKPQLDDMYFDTFEQQATQPTKQVREQSQSYEAAPPEDDLITLRSLSYALRVDATTIHAWIEQGKLSPDGQSSTRSRTNYFFRRNRIDQIRRDLVRSAQPRSDAEWRQEFLDFARSRHLSKSYKPVLLKALLKLVDRNGEVKLDNLAHEFRAFYIQRKYAGLPTEFGVKLLTDPEAASIDAVKRLIVKYPLDRFLIKGFLQYEPAENVVRFAPQLWHELRFYEWLDIQASVDEQLSYYYDRHA